MRIDFFSQFLLYIYRRKTKKASSLAWKLKEDFFKNSLKQRTTDNTNYVLNEYDVEQRQKAYEILGKFLIIKSKYDTYLAKVRKLRKKL